MNPPPEPLVPLEIDLRGYGFMPFYGAHLLNSDFDSKTSDAAWRAAIYLWWASWNQVPAASLPDDDVFLAKAANLGRDVRTWKKLREQALYGFIKCTDGRLYHRFLAPLALEAYQRRKAEREKKRRWRGRSAGPDFLAEETGTAPCQETGTGLSPGPLTGTERGTGTGNGGDKPPTPFALPDWVPVDPWNGFVEMRQRMRKPLTERAKFLTVNDLQRLREQGHDPGAVLDQSVRRSWQGVFPLKADYTRPGPQAGLEQRNRDAAEQFLRQGETDEGPGPKGVH